MLLKTLVGIVTTNVTEYNSFQETCVQLFSALELTFSIDLSAEEGGGNVELVPNGRDLEVTAANVYSYVRKYSHYRWVRKGITRIEDGQTGFFRELKEESS